MKCPFCKNPNTKVTNKRDTAETIRRRRECIKCGKRFTTYEKIKQRPIIIVKKDRRRESYNRNKIFSGIIKACEKRPISHEKVEKIVDEIEKKIFKKGKEVKSSQIGEMIMKSLKKLDKVAYIRFASVYREFKDLSDFKKEIKQVSIISKK